MILQFAFGTYLLGFSDLFDLGTRREPITLTADQYPRVDLDNKLKNLESRHIHCNLLPTMAS